MAKSYTYSCTASAWGLYLYSPALEFNYSATPPPPPSQQSKYGLLIPVQYTIPYSGLISRDENFEDFAISSKF